MIFHQCGILSLSHRLIIHPLPILSNYNIKLLFLSPQVSLMMIDSDSLILTENYIIPEMNPGPEIMSISSI
jgi:hypothetical protein